MEQKLFTRIFHQTEPSLSDRFRILTEGAKYDVSCSSSGSDRQGCFAGGICHTFTPDGRCVSLLKILMSNDCRYQCRYCPNRKDLDIPRATLSPTELCEITDSFYRRNYIEGLFLSSAVFNTPDITMERMLQAVILLRKVYRFQGYIHMKAIPGCDPLLIRRAAEYADRMSVNTELPSRAGLQRLAPQKKPEHLAAPMTQLAQIWRERKETGQRILPAGQTTQMIVGATPDRDATILALTERLYLRYGMKRVYYSAYSPVGDPKVLPTEPEERLRENRLYQADWLLRFYGFSAGELLAPGENLDPDLDPKSAWALRNPQQFPIEINTAPYEMLLRVPGIGIRSAHRILQARKETQLTCEDLQKMKVVLRRASHFILCNGKYQGCGENRTILRSRLLIPGARQVSPDQYSLFSTVQTAMTLTGEL